MIRCQCRFINHNKCTTLVEEVDNGGDYVCVGTGCIWEISVPSAQFCYEPKTTLKNRHFTKKNVDKNVSSRAHSKTIVNAYHYSNNENYIYYAFSMHIYL